MESTIAGILTFSFFAFIVWTLFGSAVKHYNATKMQHETYLSREMEKREKERQKLVKEATDAVFTQIVKGGFQIVQKGMERADHAAKGEKPNLVHEPAAAEPATSAVAPGEITGNAVKSQVELAKPRIKEATGRVTSMGEIKKPGTDYFIYRVTVKQDDGSSVDFDGKGLKAQSFRIGDKVTIRQLPTASKTGADGKAFKVNQFEVAIHAPENEAKEVAAQTDSHLVDDPIEAANEELHSASAQANGSGQAELEFFG